MYQNPNQNDKSQTRNLILAVVLSALVMGLWQYFYEIPRLKAYKEAKAKAQKEQVLKQQEMLKANPELAEKIVQQIKSAPVITEKKREELISENVRVKISNPKLHGSINLTGARLDDITLAKYKLENKKNSPEVILLSPAGTKEPNLVENGWISAVPDIKTPDNKTTWTVEGNNTLTSKTPITLKWDNGQGLIFKNIYSIDKNYMFNIKQIVENKSNKSVVLYPYGLISKSEPKNEQSLGMILHTGAIGVMDGTLKEVPYSDLREEKSFSFPDSTGWVGITDKYWFKSLIPSADEKYKANFRYTTDSVMEKFQVDFMGQAREIKPNEITEYNSMLFTGAKELKILEKYRDQKELKLFDRAIDFGWVFFLSQPLMKILLFFHKHVDNMGLCILMLTLCVKLCLFPLAKKSYIAMGKMKVLTPKIKDLQTRYKDDKMQLQKSMMELYKKEKVSPASGCLPLLLQIPVFIALYQVFFVSIEMRHAPFFGWVTDLSVQDPTTIFNLFGLMDFSVPSFLMIGAWPVLYFISLKIQQSISPQPSDATQAQVMKIMPWIFTFMFASFPAGLVIYWTFSNVLTILQQLYFLKHLPK